MLAPHERRSTIQSSCDGDDEGQPGRRYSSGTTPAHNASRARTTLQSQPSPEGARRRRSTGHRLHAQAGRGFCRRLLLARMSRAYVVAQEQRRVLEGQDRANSSARSGAGSRAPRGRLGRRPSMGTRRGRPSDGSYPEDPRELPAVGCRGDTQLSMSASRASTSKAGIMSSTERATACLAIRTCSVSTGFLLLFSRFLRSSCKSNIPRPVPTA